MLILPTVLPGNAETRGNVRNITWSLTDSDINGGSISLVLQKYWTDSDSVPLFPKTILQHSQKLYENVSPNLSGKKNICLLFHGQKK